MTYGVSEATLTTQLVALASALVRTANAGNESLHRALANAEPRLLELGWEVSGGILQIQSATTSGRLWETDGERCSCPTSRGVCWHNGAWWILSVCAAAGIAPLAPVQLPRALREANPRTHEIVDDIPGNFLGDFPPLPPADFDWSPEEGASYQPDAIPPPASHRSPGPRVDSAARELEKIEEAALQRKIARLLRPQLDPAELERLANELL